MVLSDRDIKAELARGRIVIKPPPKAECIQPASVDIHLGRKMRFFRFWKPPHQIDLRQPLDGLTELVDMEEAFSLAPAQFVLGTTVEYIELPDDIMARLEGKSSLGRIGLLVHSTAGYVDPGFQGHLTLELYNVSALPIILYPEMRVSQLSFHKLTSPAERPYGTAGLASKYQHQDEPTPTRYYQEFPQPTLMSLPSIPLKGTLREWLANSEFRGSVRRFSQALGVPLKTVEDWIYRGSHPSPRHYRQLFTITHLSEFRGAAQGQN